MKGRKPKTTEQHIADGTLEKSRHISRASAPPLDGIPAAPVGFDARHISRWNEICGMLKEMNVLSTADIHAVRRYTELTLTADDAYQRFNERGERQDWLIYIQAVQQQKKMMDDFGFTPRARMAIKVEKPKQESPILAAMAGAKIKVG